MFKLGKFYQTANSDKYIFIVDIKKEISGLVTNYYAKKIILYVDKLDDPSWTIATKDYDWIANNQYSNDLTLVEPPTEIKEWVKSYLENQISIHNKALDSLCS